MMAIKKRNKWVICLFCIFAFALFGVGLLTQRAFAAEIPQAPAVAQEVVLPTLTVTLQDEDGEPISDVSLAAIVSDGTGREKERVTTDLNGKAVFKRLKSGSYYFFANINKLRQHAGYGMPAMVKEFKTSRSYYLSESRQFDLQENTESTYTIKRNEFIWFETYLQVVRTGKIIVMNKKMGMQQIIPVASMDYLQIYLPMRSLYYIVTIKDDDFDSWVMEFYAHENLRIELL
ncbi:hypothetical protein [Azotosporobacter soli]|uniref:hypothetical protein n=1 Tax=Azotosporobacter soli TaxID=3055040 RepID=UPI0031FEA26A